MGFFISAMISARRRAYLHVTSHVISPANVISDRQTAQRKR